MNRALLQHSIVATILCAMCLLCSPAWAQDRPVRLLFIGNSLTSVNNLPNMVKKLTKSRGVAVEYVTHLGGAKQLRNHAEDRVLHKKMKRPFDAVIIQEQSQITAFRQNQVEKDVYPFAQKIVEMARAVNPKVYIMFYLTPAHKDGDFVNGNYFPAIVSYEGMQQQVTQSYVQMRRDNDALVAPAGAVWQIVRERHPELLLYRDSNHPSLMGTYLVACTMYASLWQQACTGMKAPMQIHPDAVSKIQNIVDEVVFARQIKWDYRKRTN